MAEMLLKKDPGGALLPATEMDREAIEKLKAGEMYLVKVTRKRNAKFLQKWIVLLEYAFNLFSESHPSIMVGNIEVKPDFTRFRHDVTIMAGFYRAVMNANGEARLVPESVSFDNMEEDQFEKVYSATLDVLIDKVLKDRGLTKDQVEEAVKHILKFS